MLFARICIENQVTFKCFFKLSSKKVTIEVISDKDESYEQKLDDLRAKGQEVIVIDNNSTKEEFDNNPKDFFQRLNNC